MHRRSFLAASLAAPLLPRLGRAQEAAFPGMIVRMSEPKNLEFPFASLAKSVLPTERFFVRNHFPAPTIDVKTWKLTIDGAVKKPLTLTYDDLLKMPSVTLAATIECAGNNRVHLTPPVPGLQWGFGGVGHAEWKGVSLAAVLDQAGLDADAVEIVLEGADRGTINNDPKSPGPIAFARSLPRAKALAAETILAYAMNDQPLTVDHGFPVRAIVGGWYGMAAVKWLTHLRAVKQPFQGFWQTLDYAVWDRSTGEPSLIPITRMQPKAAIARPALGATVPAGGDVTITGAAWAGERAVAKVEVSTDGGATWTPAKLLGDAKPFAWVLWEFAWRTPNVAGPAKLVARCFDTAGDGQPEKRDSDRRSYMINHLIPTDVMVR